MTLAPYMVSAIGLLLLSGIRSWGFCAQSVDRAAALVLIASAAIIAGLAGLGTDTEAYREHYESLPALDNRFVWWDAGFALFATLFSSAGAPYGLFVFVCVFMSHAVKLFVFDRVIKNLLLPFFVLFCLNVGEVAFVRQYLAASFLLLSFYMLSRRRDAAAFLILLCAALLHKTAVVPGAVFLAMHYRWRILQPLLAVIGVAVLAYLLAPAALLQSYESRIGVQIASYAAQGFVQGLQDEETSLLRNVVKYLLYVALAMWMRTVPAETPEQRIQRSAATLVIYLSVASLLLVTLVSPAFARLSAYVFPFLALSMRPERFAASKSELATQYLMSLALFANLAISIAPLIEFF